MGIQSKLIPDPFSPVYNVLALYSLALAKRPLLTKAITSGVLSGLGNAIGQKLQGDINRRFAWRSLIAFASYGLFVGGPITHFWLNFLERYGPKNTWVKLFVDRFLYGPLILLLTLYLLSIFQGNGHRTSVRNIKKTYSSALQANLKIWVICQYVNLNFVPLQFRTLFTNLIALVWNIYLSGKQSRENLK